MSNKIENLSESLEDYLEAILDLEKKNKVARIKDIADRLDFQRGSVTIAMRNLAEKKLINYEPYSFITLTDQGKKIAEEITRRHAVIKDFLIKILQLEEESSDTLACRMEHAMDKKSIDRLVQFINFIDKCPKTGENWIKRFVKYCRNGMQDVNTCKKCIDKDLKKLMKNEK